MNEETMEAKARDEFLLKTRFPEECKRLPLDYLRPNDKELAEKCINKEELTEDEISDLKKLLADYRGYFKEYDVIKVEENLKDNLKIIKTSDDLLRLLNDPNRYRIDMIYNIAGQRCLLQLKLKQIPDSDYISLLDAQTRIFKKLNNSEKKVYGKLSRGEQLSEEEANMQKQIQDKIDEITFNYEDNAQQFTDILAKVVDFVDDPEKPYPEKLAFWKSVDLGARILLFTKVKEKLNIGMDIEEDLFPPIR